LRRVVVDYFIYAVRPGASARRAARHPACRRLLRLRRASRCLGTSHGSSRSSSLTTSPRADSSSTTSPTPRVRVPRHVTRLVTRLVVDYFDYAARSGALARRVAHHAARRAACRRLLRLRRASGCLGTSLGLLRGSSSTTTTTPRVRVPRHVARLITRLVAPLVVDYFTYAVRPGASARRVAHLAARRRLLHRSSSTTSTLLRVRVPRHVAWLVTWLVVDYSMRRDFLLRPQWLYFSHAVRRDYLSCGNTGSTSSTPRAATTSSSSRIASTIHLD
jgi:hypothetical protein